MGYHKRQSDGPPAWFVFLLGVAFIFGAFYLWTNFQDFLRTGGLSVNQATQISREQASETAVQQVTVVAAFPTRRPSPTPKPDCQDFVVTAASAIVRQQASTAASLIESLPEGTVICVLASIDGGDGFLWYLIDRDPITRLIETGYMREDVVRAANPTPTPSNTFLAPSITPTLESTSTPSPTGTSPSQSTLIPSLAPSITPTVEENEGEIRL